MNCRFRRFFAFVMARGDFPVCCDEWSGFGWTRFYGAGCRCDNGHAESGAAPRGRRAFAQM